MKPLSESEFECLQEDWPEVLLRAPGGWMNRFAWSISVQMADDPGWRPSRQQLETMRRLHGRLITGDLWR